MSSYSRINATACFLPILFPCVKLSPGIILTPSQPPDPRQRHPSTSTSFHLPSFHVVIVFLLSAVQTISSIALTLIHSYKRAVHGIQIVNQHHNLRHSDSSSIEPSPTPSSPASPSPGSQPSTVVTDDKADLAAHTQSFTSDHSPLLPGADNQIPYKFDLIDDDLTSSSLSVPLLQPRPAPPPPPHYPLPAALTRPRPAPTGLARAPVALFVELLTLKTRYAGSAVALLTGMLQAGFAPFLDRFLSSCLFYR